MKDKTTSQNLKYKEALELIASEKFPPVCLFYGEETYLREELQRYLAAKFLGPEAGYALEKVDGAAVSLEDVISSLQGGNIFSAKKVVVINDPPYLAPPRPEKGKKESQEEEEPVVSGKSGGDRAILEQLQGFIEESPSAPFSILIFQTSGVDRRKKIVKYLLQKALVVECSHLKGAELAAWIRGRVKKAGKKIEGKALEKLLISGIESLWQISLELEKCITYLDAGEEVITEDVVELLHAGDAQANVFKMVDALSDGYANRAIYLLHLLLARREQPVMIFFMLVRHYRLLLAALALQKEGVPPAQHHSALKVHPFVAGKLRRQLEFYRQETLEEILIELHKNDLDIKTGRLEPGRAIEKAIGQIHYKLGRPSCPHQTGTPSEG